MRRPLHRTRNRTLVSESHLRLGRVDVDVDGTGIELDRTIASGCRPTISRL